MSKAKPKADTLLALDAVAWRQRIKQLAVDDSDNWPPEVWDEAEYMIEQIADALLTRPAYLGLPSVKATKAGCSMTRHDFWTVISYGYRAGFANAMQMHRRELLAAGDLVEIKRGQIRGGDKGRAKQAREKSDRHARIQSMLAQGIEPKEIARAIPCSISTVYRALNPAGSKPTKRPRSSRRR